MRPAPALSVVVLCAVAHAAPLPDTSARVSAAETLVRGKLDTNRGWKLDGQSQFIAKLSDARITGKIVRVETSRRGLFGKQRVNHYVEVGEDGQAKWLGSENQNLGHMMGKRAPLHEMLLAARDSQFGGLGKTLLSGSAGVLAAAPFGHGITLLGVAFPPLAVTLGVAGAGLGMAWHFTGQAYDKQQNARLDALTATAKAYAGTDLGELYARYEVEMTRGRSNANPFGIGCFFEQLAVNGY